MKTSTFYLLLVLGLVLLVYAGKVRSGLK